MNAMSNECKFFIRVRDQQKQKALQSVSCGYFVDPVAPWMKVFLSSYFKIQKAVAEMYMHTEKLCRKYHSRDLFTNLHAFELLCHISFYQYYELLCLYLR